MALHHKHRAPATAEQTDALVQLVRDRLLPHPGEWERFIETGYVHHEYGGGTYGELRDGASWEADRKAAAIYYPSEAEADSAALYHDYCALQGYPGGELSGITEAPGNDYPPPPTHDGEGVWVGMTYAAVRERARGEVPEQMELAL